MGHDEIQGFDREEVPFAGASWLKKKKNGLARYPSKSKNSQKAVGCIPWLTAVHPSCWATRIIALAMTGRALGTGKYH